MVSESLDLPLLLKGVDNVLVSPSDLVRESLEGAVGSNQTSNRSEPVRQPSTRRKIRQKHPPVLSSGLQSEDSEGLGNDHLLLPVVRRGHTLVELESLKGGGSSGSLVGNHSSDSLVKDSGRSSVMERTGLLGVDQMPLVEVVVVSKLSKWCSTRG